MDRELDLNKGAGQRCIDRLLIGILYGEKKVRKKDGFLNNWILNFFGFVAFLVLPFSFVPGVIDPPPPLSFTVFHLVFFITGVYPLAFMGNASQPEKSSAVMAHLGIFWVGGAFLIMAAVVVSSYHRLYPVKIRGGRRGWGRALKSVMVILLMVCCLGSGLRLYSEIQLKKALQARARGEWNPVIDHIDRAFLSVYSIDPFGVPLPWYGGMAHYNNHNLPLALKNFRMALAYHPYHDHSLNNLSILREMKKGTEPKDD